jgi:hypothetical protein
MPRPNAQAGPLKQLHKLEVRCERWPGNLRTAADIAPDLGITAERLTSLADGGFAPHCRVDDGQPLFQTSELKQWAARNLLAKHGGSDLPMPVVINFEATRVKDFRGVPFELRCVENLRDITGETRRCGIYFLCLAGGIQYVGQSVNAAARIAEHAPKHRGPRVPEGGFKDFDKVYFLPWPADELDQIEGALIRALRPPLNGRTARGTMRCNGERAHDASVLESIGFGVKQTVDNQASAI